jgi:hypothetical protein
MNDQEFLRVEKEGVKNILYFADERMIRTAFQRDRKWVEDIFHNNKVIQENYL